jgi:outer membrane murein-binding lipoprotein Lpp
MTSTSAIALASVLIAVCTLVATLMTSRRSASTSYVQELEGRVAQLEKDLGDERGKNRRLQERYNSQAEENLRLMRKLLAQGST